MGQYTVWLYPKIGKDRQDASLPVGYYQGSSPHLGKITAFKTVIKDKNSPNYGQEVICLELAKGRRMLKDRKQMKLADK